MTRPVILLDADGVLFNFVAHARALAAEVGVPILAEGHELFLPGTLSEAELKRYISTRPGWVFSIPVFPNVKSALRRLREVGEVVCVTKPWKGVRGWHEEREAALMQHLGFARDDLYFCANKTRVQGDIFVDDLRSHVTAWAAAHPRKVAFHWWPHPLADCPVGRNVSDNVYSTASWDAIVQAATCTGLYHAEDT
jgi:hypothetical protein